MQYVIDTTFNTLGCVFSETVPLLSLRLPSEETASWETAEKGKRHGAPNNSTQTSSGTFLLKLN